MFPSLALLTLFPPAVTACGRATHQGPQEHGGTLTGNKKDKLQGTACRQVNGSRRIQ